MAAFRADGHADADLARPLGHRDEHDVHDPDAADEQRHRRDREQQRAKDLHLRVLRLRDLFLRAHLKIEIAAGRDAVSLTQNCFDLRLRVGDAFR